MDRKTTNTDDSWETDAVWKLLGESPPAAASPRFADNTLRAARLTEQAPRRPIWWTRLTTPAPLAGLAAATAAVAFAAITLIGPNPNPAPAPVTSSPDNAAEIAEIAEMETLIAALDQLDNFTDTELVTLIGF